jgi:hypothetical protein
LLYRIKRAYFNTFSIIDKVIIFTKNASYFKAFHFNTVRRVRKAVRGRGKMQRRALFNTISSVIKLS